MTLSLLLPPLRGASHPLRRLPWLRPMSLNQFASGVGAEGSVDVDDESSSEDSDDE